MSAGTDLRKDDSPGHCRLTRSFPKSVSSTFTGLGSTYCEPVHGNGKRKPEAGNGIRKTGKTGKWENWKTGKNGQNWSKWVKTGQNWSCPINYRLLARESGPGSPGRLYPNTSLITPGKVKTGSRTGPERVQKGSKRVKSEG